MNSFFATHHFREAYPARFLRFSALCALLFISPKASALSPEASEMLRQYPQALNMSGYVLNGEMNMNRIYSRKLDPGINPTGDKDNSPVIIFEKARTPEGQPSPFLMNVEKQWPPIQSP